MRYTVHKTTDTEHADKVPYITSSMMEAVNTCPRWGIVHNVLGKRFIASYRQMALEAGSLMHEVFACLNLLHIGVNRKLRDHMHYNGQLLFTKERWEEIWHDNVTIDDIVALERIIFACVNTGNFIDDSNDRNRTLANLENCAIELLKFHLTNLMDFPILVSDPTGKKNYHVGIEMSLDAVINVDKGPSLRCLGLADVVYKNESTGEITLGEYKTTSSMNDAWRAAFETRHQITLYNTLLQAYFGIKKVFNTIIVGSAIPVRRTGAPVQFFTVKRDQENITELINTIVFTQNIIDKYRNQPLEAPMFTHSCSRFFRPCSMLDICTAIKEDQYGMLDNMLDRPTLSPSERKAMMRNQ